MSFLANCHFQTDKMRIADKKSEQMKVRVIVEEKDHQLADKTRTDNKDEANKRDRNNKWYSETEPSTSTNIYKMGQPCRL